jgi:hypothetical protein
MCFQATCALKERRFSASSLPGFAFKTFVIERGWLVKIITSADYFAREKPVKPSLFEIADTLPVP